MKHEAYEYTKKVLCTFKELGIDIPYVQIGNEITNGFMWPHGQLIEGKHGEKRGNYEHFIDLLNVCIKGAREVLPNARLIIHLERSNDEKVYDELFSELQSHNVDYDVIGMSYYPYWHGTFTQLFNNIKKCQNKFHKPVMICELGYGFTLEDYILTNNGTSELKVTKENLEAELPFDISIEGQRQFIETFLKLCFNEKLEGVIYWEPLWIPGDNICWASHEGQRYIHEEGKPTRNEWSNQCLIDYGGNKLPAFDAYNINKHKKEEIL